MLARANRLLTADDFRTVLRKGRRVAFENSTVSVIRTDSGDPARFGVLVTRKVGNAVKRNLVRRRVKAIAWELVHGGVAGVDVVVRAHPSSVSVGWDDLRDEVSRAVRMGSKKAGVTG